MADSGGAEGVRTNRKLKTAEKEDPLSALPDSLIHHILSFLPSTKQAIQTSILSKRWHNQWTFVSNLIFDFSGMFSDNSRENIPVTSYAIARIVEQTLFLHQCSKLQKFQFVTDKFYKHEYDPNSGDKIRFVVGKKVEELILKFSDRRQFRLPEFFFSQPCFVKLKLFRCYMMPTVMVNWKSLKDLSLENCSCTCEVITSIVSGSPLLQSLEVKCRLYRPVRLVIASESLKRLVVHNPCCYVDISCPNLVEFDGCSIVIRYKNFGWCDKVLEKFLSDSPLLESLKLENFAFCNIRIASESLKKFNFRGRRSKEIEISCPHLEELGLFGRLETIKLMNLSSSVCAFLGCKATAVKQILEGVQHLNELKFGKFFLESLSALEMDFISHPLLKCKSLTLEGSYGSRVFEHIPGIAYALQSSPLLERLVVELQPFKSLLSSIVFICSIVCGSNILLQYLHIGDRLGWDNSEENYWNSNETHLSNLVSHLRTLKITGFSQRQHNSKRVLDFVEFVLKNASALEKMVIILEECGTEFVIKVSQKLLSFPRCSAAIVELLSPKNM